MRRKREKGREERKQKKLSLFFQNPPSTNSHRWDPLPAAAERAILKFVHSLACSRVRDDPELFGEEEEDEDEESEAKKSGAKNLGFDVASLFTSSNPRSSSSSVPAAPLLDPQASLLVRVLHLRAAFGGMPCDVAMMREAAETWLRRFAGRGGMPPRSAVAAAAEANRTPTQQQQQQQQSLPAGEAWLDFLWRSFSPPAIPPLALPPGAAAASVGRMALEDVPLSACDFHVSAISEELMNLPAVAREAQKAAARAAAGEEDGSGSGAADAEERLRRAMWLFRSSRNVRSRPSAAALVLNGESARAGALRAQRASERDDLRPLWRAAAAAADSWSSEFLRQRFGARGRF